jgi:hypothetical protein
MTGINRAEGARFVTQTSEETSTMSLDIVTSRNVRDVQRWNQSLKTLPRLHESGALEHLSGHDIYGNR